MHYTYTFNPSTFTHMLHLHIQMYIDAYSVSFIENERRSPHANSSCHPKQRCGTSGGWEAFRRSGGLWRLPSSRQEGFLQTTSRATPWRWNVGGMRRGLSDQNFGMVWCPEVVQLYHVVSSQRVCLFATNVQPVQQFSGHVKIQYFWEVISKGEVDKWSSFFGSAWFLNTTMSPVWTLSFPKIAWPFGHSLPFLSCHLRWNVPHIQKQKAFVFIHTWHQASSQLGKGLIIIRKISIPISKAWWLFWIFHALCFGYGNLG